MQPKTKCTIGWALCIVVSLFLIGPSAMGKFVEWEGKAEMFDRMGVTSDLVTKIGVLEITLALLLVIPRAGFLAAVLLTGYLGGAIMTHLRVGEPIFFPIAVAIVMWIGVGLRFPQVFALALGKPDQP
jgi:hypothetical protein